jgi:hypothetical protein
MSSILNLTASDIELMPYPHATSDQVIDPDVFEDLRREFPPEELFLSNQKQAYGAGRAARINLMRHDKNFKKLQRESKAWADFINRLNSSEFVEEIVRLFANHILSFGGLFDSKCWKFSPTEPHPPESLIERALYKFGIQQVLDQFLALLDKNKLCVSIDIAWAREGYSTEIHTDNRNKFAAFLLYFNETDGRGGEFLIHEVKNMTVPLANLRYPKDEEVRVVKVLAPKPNRGAVLLNCNSAYHGVQPLTDNKTYRQFLYVSVGSPYSIPIWKET